MRQDHRFRKKKGLTDEHRRILSMALIPLVVIVLIVVIRVADHAVGAEVSQKTPAVEAESGQGMADGEDAAAAGADGETLDGSDGDIGIQGADGADSDTEVPGADEGQAQGETASGEGEDSPEAENTGDAFVTEQFQRDSVPEILELMKTYFQARQQADAETMNKLYGIEGVSFEALEAQKTKMRSNAKYVSDFQNISTYVMNGTTADSWLVYTLADIQFYTAKTAAPMIMWCYVQKNEDGAYQIVENSKLSSNVQLFINAANHSQEVRALAADVNGRLKKALAEDEDLNSIYGVIRDGSPVWEGNNQEAPVVVLDETEPESENGAGDEEVPEVSIDGETDGTETETGGADEADAAAETAGAGESGAEMVAAAE